MPPAAPCRIACDYVDPAVEQVALVPDDLRQPGCWRGVAAALGADDAVDDGHADAGEVAELHAVEDVLARRMLCLVHDDEVSGAADLDNAAVQRAPPRGVAGRGAERDFRRERAEPCQTR